MQYQKLKLQLKRGKCMSKVENNQPNNTVNLFGKFGKGKPCGNPECAHNSRDHYRSTKKNGIWTGKCTVWNCDCIEYIQTVSMEKT